MFVDVCIGKMFLFGVLLGCFDFIFMIVGVMSGRLLFFLLKDNCDVADKAK